MLNAAKAYLATQVSTASKGDLLVMLYDTAIKHLRQAIEKIRARDVAGKGILISKAITIISELQESLDKERGGEIAQNLFQLYFFCNSRLLMANLKMQPEMVEDVITILSKLRQAFAQILPQNEGVASMTQPGGDGSAALREPSPPAPAEPADGAAVPAAHRHVSVANATDTDAGLALGAGLLAGMPTPAMSHKMAAAEPPTENAGEQAHAAPALNPLVAPPVQPSQSDQPEPQQNAPATRAPGLRLRAVNAYSHSR